MKAVRIFTNKDFLERAHPKTYFPSKLWGFFGQLKFCKLWWESLIKAKGEIQRSRPKPECHPAMARDLALPRFPSLLICCFANSIYQSLNRGSFTAMLQQLGKVCALQAWAAHPFQVFLLELLLPGCSLQCGMDAWLRECPQSSPSHTEWLSAWPWDCS